MLHMRHFAKFDNQKKLNKRLTIEPFFGISVGASNAIVATGLPLSLTCAVPICCPALIGAATDAGRL